MITWPIKQSQIGAALRCCLTCFSDEKNQQRTAKHKFTTLLESTTYHVSKISSHQVSKYIPYSSLISEVYTKTHLLPQKEKMVETINRAKIRWRPPLLSWTNASSPFLLSCNTFPRQISLKFSRSKSPFWAINFLKSCTYFAP